MKKSNTRRMNKLIYICMYICRHAGMQAGRLAGLQAGRKQVRIIKRRVIMEKDK